MRKGTLRSLMEGAKLETGGSDVQAQHLAAAKLQRLFDDGKISVDDFSFKAMFEELVDPDNEKNFNIHTDAKELAEAVASSAFPTISGVVINSTIIPAYELAVGPAGRLVSESMATKTSREEVAGWMAGGQFEMRPEHTSYQEDVITEKYWSIDKYDFGKIISLTREAIFDDRSGELIGRARGLGEKGGQLRAKIITQTFEVAARTAQGESTSQAAVYMGTAISASNFYNADHSALIDSAGTNANIVTSNGLGTDQAINSANTLFSKFVDENGEQVVITPQVLVYPAALHQTAQELLYGTTKRSISATLDEGHLGNVWRGRFDPIELTFLSDDTTWYLGDPRKQMMWLWVWRPETKVQNADSESAFHAQIVLRYRFSWYGGCGHTDYRFIVKNTA
jgi:hypothetical protein